MTAPMDTKSERATAQKTTGGDVHPLLKLLLELGPLVAFFVAFRYFDGEGEADDLPALINATIALMIAMGVCMGTLYAMTRTISKMAALTLVVVLFLGGLTVWFNSDLFIKLKPTLVNLCFGGALLYGMVRGVSYLKYLMGELLPMRDEGWDVLTRNWTIYFFAMALINEIVWRTQDHSTWVDAKTFLYPALTLIFTLSQTTVMNKHLIESPSDDGA
ncbi:MAG: inner membrane-spanning protein YciB [Pseudomonadota bacterium]